MPPLAIGAAAVIVAATGTGVAVARTGGSSADTPSAVQLSNRSTLLDDRFAGPNGLVTNEYATEHPGAGANSPTWMVTSGSLFRRDGLGWSGPPDTVAPG